jgi:2-keto-4-pentenoate hydratase/2-oxohepta-3-ene-1,7-dioic acid hydratase in catechol pathway
VRLVSFITSRPGPARFGVLDGDQVIEPGPTLTADLLRRHGDAAQSRAEPAATDMVAFFRSGSAGLRRAEEAVAIARDRLAAGIELHAADGSPTVHPLGGVQLLAPVSRPRRIRDYLTYSQHASGSGLDAGTAAMAVPACYQCNVETIIGPDEPLVWPSYTDQLDFELELGFFTSRGGRDLTIAEAKRSIAGVTLFNDVSARDIQFAEMAMQIGPSKGKHFCTAMGPCVLTMDEVDEWDITLSASVNGDPWVVGSTRHREFSFAEVLAWASLDEPVYPGEFFAVGTVGGGCGLELDRWIEPGDVVELQASGVGVLRNPVGAKVRRRDGSGLAGYAGAPRVQVQHG